MDCLSISKPLYHFYTSRNSFWGKEFTVNPHFARWEHHNQTHTYLQLLPLKDNSCILKKVIYFHCFNLSTVVLALNISIHSPTVLFTIHWNVYSTNTIHIFRNVREMHNFVRFKKVTLICTGSSNHPRSKIYKAVSTQLCKGRCYSDKAANLLIQ